MILGLMSSGLLPRVCPFGVPGQRKTHGHPGYENDFVDLESDLPAAFVANDVPAAFCAPEVFENAAMIACDFWGLMLGAKISAFEDAAMLCFQKSEWNASFSLNNGWVLGRFLELLGVLPHLMANSGSSLCVSPCGLVSGCLAPISWAASAPVAAIWFLRLRPRWLDADRAGCCLGCCLVVAKTRAASAELFGMRIRHTAAAFVAAFQSYNFDTIRVAPACEYLCNVRDLHVWGGISTFIPVWEDVFESASLDFAWTWLSGIVVLCAGSWNLFGARRDYGKVSSNPLGNEKIRFVQKYIKGSSEPSDLQDHVDFKGNDRHDTDGSLSLGTGGGFWTGGRPRQSVKQLVDKAIRSPQSVVVNQSLRVETTL